MASMPSYQSECQGMNVECLLRPDIMMRQAAQANDRQIDKITSWENVLVTWGTPVDQKEAEKQKEFARLIPP